MCQDINNLNATNSNTTISAHYKYNTLTGVSSWDTNASFWDLDHFWDTDTLIRLKCS